MLRQEEMELIYTIERANINDLKFLPIESFLALNLTIYNIQPQPHCRRIADCVKHFPLSNY